MSEAILPTSPATEQAPTALQHQSPIRKWAGLFVLTLGLAIIIIDTTLLNVSLSTIIKDLHTDLQSLQWVITSYALVLAAFTITGGRFGDLFGRRKMFMLGAIIFAAGSFIASISHAMPILLLGESIIEGFGAALMAPATASLVVANFTGKDRATAFGIWGGVAGASSAVGPLLGGYLTSHYSWRWGFRINVFIAVLVVVGSLWLINESRDERKPSLDWWGVLLSALGLFLVTFGIVESSTLGWWHAKSALFVFGHTLSFGSLSLVPVSMFAGFLVLAAFAWWENKVEKTGKSPLVSMKMFQNRQFTSGVATITILTLGLTGMIFALPVFLQSVKNLDAFHTGLALVPLSAAILVVAPIVGALSRKYEPRYFIWAGLVIDVIAAFIIRATLSADVPISHLVPGLALYGLGMAMVFAPISNIILSAVPVQMAGEASGVNNTMRQVGATLGAAIIGAAILTSLSSHLVNGIQASQIIPDNAKAQIISVVSNPNSNVEFGSSPASSNLPPLVQQEIHALVNEAAVRSTKDAYVYSALFAFMCLIVALFLPKMHTAKDDAEVEIDTGIAPHKFASAAAVIILAIIGSGWLLHQSAKATISTGLVNIDNVRGAFTDNPTPQTPTPAPNPEPTPAPTPQTIPPVQGMMPRGPQTQNTPSPKPSIGTAVESYKNTALGFQTEFDPSLWQPNEHMDKNQVVFVNAAGQLYNVESIQNTGETLDTIARQLKGSPSVWNLVNTTFGGEPALEFSTSGSFTKGIAVIHNGRLFYIMGPDLNSGPLANFRFL